MPLTLENHDGFAIGFLGILVAAWVICQVTTLYQTFWPPTIRWFRKRIVLPRLFHGRHFFNPSRLQVICHLLHWVATILYNTYDVASLAQAASRAGQIAVVHIVPLLVSYQLGYVSQTLGISMKSVLELHISMGLMATVQGVVHTFIHWRMAGRLLGPMVFQITVRVYFRFCDQL